jgi:hypothetical protein
MAMMSAVVIVVMSRVLDPNRFRHVISLPGIRSAPAGHRLERSRPGTLIRKKRPGSS